MLRILQIGRGGQLSSELEALAGGEVSLSALGLPGLDLLAEGAVRAAIRAAAPFDVLVNASAYTAVDKAEAERAAAYRVNAGAVAEMAAAAAERGVPVIHVSTDYVFDGEKRGAYVETDPTGPRSVYGETKLAGEIALRCLAPRHVILRTAWVFAGHGGNFVRTMLRLAREKGALHVVDDQRGRPTHAADLAAAILAIARRLADDPPREAFGTFHYAGAGEASWADFAAAILEDAAPHGIRASLTRIGTADYPTPARRPANSVLDCRRIEDVYGITPPPWRARLPQTIARLLAG